MKLTKQELESLINEEIELVLEASALGRGFSRLGARTRGAMGSFFGGQEGDLRSRAASIFNSAGDRAEKQRNDFFDDMASLFGDLDTLPSEVSDIKAIYDEARNSYTELAKMLKEKAASIKVRSAP